MTTHRMSWLYIVAPLCLGVIAILGWYLTTAPGLIPAYLLPTPMTVAQELYESLVSHADIWPYVATTMSEALGGAFLGFVVAVPLAILIYRSRVASAATLPFLGATQAIPAIALANLLVLWIGYGLMSKVALCALMVFFPILVSSVVGFRHIDPDILSAARVDGAGSVAMLFEIEIPLALPNILAGVRNGFTLSVTGAVVGEMVMGGGGLGGLLSVQRESLNIAGMFSTIIVLALLATALYTIVSAAERRWSNLTASLPKGES